jgi:hypothetical protein
VQGLNFLIGKSSARAPAMIAEAQIDNDKHQIRIRRRTYGAAESLATLRVLYARSPIRARESFCIPGVNILAS